MPSLNELQLLLIEHHDEDATAIAKLLSANCYRSITVNRAHSLMEARQFFEKQIPGVILCSFNLPESKSLDTAKKVLEFSCGVPLIFLTGPDDNWSGMVSVELGAQAFVPKHSLNPDFLIHSILYAIEKQRLQTQLKHSSQMLEHLAMIDPVTGLFNRHGIEQIFKREIGFKHRYGAEFFVSMVDLDDFKTISAELGKEAGNIILKEAANNIKSVVRMIDYAARIEEDEFLIFLAYTPGQYVATINERIRKAITECAQNLPGREKITITCSGGCIPVETKMSFETLLKNVRHLVNESKKSGKNRILLPVIPPKKKGRY